MNCGELEQRPVRKSDVVLAVSKVYLKVVGNMNDRIYSYLLRSDDDAGDEYWPIPES